MKMMLRLFVIQLKQLLSYNTSMGKKKRQSRSIWLMLALIAGLGLYIGGIYSMQMALAFSAVGAPDMVFVFMSGLAVILSLFFIVMGANGIIFQAKDTTFLLSLPLSERKVMLAKLSAIYGEALLLTLFMLAPSMYAYTRYQSLPVAAYPLFLAIVLLLPMIATVLALIVSYIFGLFQARTKVSPMIMNIIMLAGLGGVMYFSITMQSKLIEGSIVPWALPTGWLKLAQPFYWVRNILVDTDMRSLLMLALVSILPLAAVTWLLARRFVDIISGMAVRRKSSDYRGPSGRRSPLAALVRKEIKQYINTPAYFVNTIFGPLMVLGGSLYLLFKPEMAGQIEGVLTMIGLPAGLLVIAAVISMFGMSNTTAPSISLEGSKLWILKSLPVSTMNVFHAKIILNFLLFLPPLLVAGIVSNILFDLTLLERILIFVLPLLAGLVSSLIGLIANIHFPKLDAPSDTAAVKNSASVMIGSLGVMLGTIALMLLLFWLRKYLGDHILYAALAFYALAALFLYRYLATAGVKKFRSII